ncbi:unnamed protein product [Brassica oleracea]
MLEVDYFLRLLHTMRADGIQNKFLQCYYGGCSKSMDVVHMKGGSKFTKYASDLPTTLQQQLLRVTRLKQDGLSLLSFL